VFRVDSGSRSARCTCEATAAPLRSERVYASREFRDATGCPRCALEWSRLKAHLSCTVLLFTRVHTIGSRSHRFGKNTFAAFLRRSRAPLDLVFLSRALQDASNNPTFDKISRLLSALAGDAAVPVAQNVKRTDERDFVFELEMAAIFGSMGG